MLSLTSRAFAVLALALALGAPGRLLAHGAEYLYAKLSLRPGECQLEVTADYGANPMLHDEAEARAAIAGVLRLQASSLGVPRFEKRNTLDPKMPGYDPLMDRGSEHRLLTGVWRWKPHGSSLVLEVPRESHHDVLLWTVEPARPQADPQWVMLIAGDHSPDIALPARPAASRWDLRWVTPVAWWAALLALGFMIGVAYHRLAKNEARPA